MKPVSYIFKLNEALNEEKASKEEILEEWEVEALIISLATSRGDDGFTEDEVIKIIRWAEGVRIGESLLTLVLKGFANIDWENNEPAFSITPQGREENKIGDNNGLSN